MSVWIKTERGWRPFAKPCVNSNQLEGVFKSITPEQAQAETAAHADAFCRVLDTGVSRDIKNFRYIMTGAYGERL